MTTLRWYAERLRAMGPLEVAHHARRRWRNLFDSLHLPDWTGVALERSGAYPGLPPAEAAPLALREALRRDADAILAGRWRAFGDLELRVDDPPRWQKDYLAGADLATSAAAFSLNYRSLPPGSDIKLIWELSRWWHLVRLAMAAYVLGDEAAGQACLRWLDDWVKHNPPYRGWNWTSALEAGVRLVQMTWIDALLEGSLTPGMGAIQQSLTPLRERVLPAHVEFVWRHRSFGSSANNHLVGELVGLILPAVRWPAIADRIVPLDELQAAWEYEVQRQFAPDGGNREQALHYHVFTWELCWQARAALRAANRPIAAAVDERLRRAAQFYVDVQGADGLWDYGDSDDAVLTPFCGNTARAAQEWRDWLVAPDRGGGLQFWLGAERTRSGVGPIAPSGPDGWTLYRESGYAIWRDRRWMLRWDASPLGYLSTAAHGHLDVLHLSLWLRGEAMIIDPGTGCYFVDPGLRAWLASAGAHNGPNPLRSDWWPRRRGPFLWAAPHPAPTLERLGQSGCRATLRAPSGLLERTIQPTEGGTGWAIHDRSAGLSGGFAVRWQFAPGTRLERLAERAFRLTRAGASLDVWVSAGWDDVRPVSEAHAAPAAASDGDLPGTISSTFRRTEWAPYLTLATRRGEERGAFATVFCAAEDQ